MAQLVPAASAEKESRRREVQLDLVVPLVLWLALEVVRRRLWAILALAVDQCRSVQVVPVVPWEALEE